MPPQQHTSVCDVRLRGLCNDSLNDMRIERVLHLPSLARQRRRLAADGQPQRMFVEEVARVDDFASCL